MYIVKFIVLLLFVGFIAGCASKKHENIEQEFAYGELCSKNTNDCLITELKNNNVSVFYLGDRMKLEIPLTRVFYNGTTSTLLDKPQVLDLVIQWLQCYQKVSVRIQINYGKDADSTLSRMRTMEQEEAVLRYLNTKSIDARWVYLSRASGNSLTGYPALSITTRKLP